MIRLIQFTLVGIGVLGLNCPLLHEYKNPSDPESPTFNVPPEFKSLVKDFADTIPVNQLYIDTLHATDADNDDLTFTLLVSPVGLVLNDSIVQWMPTGENVDTHTVSVVVADPLGHTDTIQWSITVYNVPPEFKSLVKDLTNSIPLNRLYVDTLHATDTDNDDLKFALLLSPVGLVLLDSIVQWTPSGENIDTHTVSVIVTDSLGNAATITWILTVFNTSPYFATLDNEKDTSIFVGRLYSDTIRAIDIDSDSLAFTFVTSVLGLTISDSVVMWTPDTAQIDTHDIQVQVTDGNGGIDTVSWTITVFDTNNPVTFLSNPDSLRDTILTNVPYGVTLSVLNPDYDSLAFKLVYPPPRLTIDSAVISWMPYPSDTGSHTVTVIVEDNKGAADTLVWDLVVSISPKDWVIHSGGGSVSLDSMSSDSVKITVKVSNAPMNGYSLNGWLIHSPIDTGVNDTIFLTNFTQANVSTFTLGHKNLFTVLGASNGRYVTGYIVTIDTTATPKSPSTVVYSGTIDNDLFTSLRRIVEKAEDSLATGGRSFLDASYRDLEQTILHAGYAAAGSWTTHAKHVGNSITGTNNMIVSYSNDINPAGDINGPQFYFNLIQSYLLTDIKPALQSTDVEARAFADSLILLVDKISFRLGRALDDNGDTFEAVSLADAKTIVNGRLLPILQIIRNNDYHAGGVAFLDAGVVSLKPFFRRLYRVYLTPAP